jgi:LPPG:FO 2-phospho-L-lactate transferase
MSGRFVLALAGGVGGGKFARGLAAVLPPEELTVVVNTADDFVHLGLHVSPDIDSVLYALTDRNDPERGWGLAGETWHFMEGLRGLGVDAWFQLGDRDLATHVLRTAWLAAGRSLSDVTVLLAQRMGIAHAVAPMTDRPVRSMVETDEGTLPFQDYFVKRQCEPAFRGVTFEGAAGAEPSAVFRAAIERTSAILIAPSNPYISIDPILALGNVRELLRRSRAPVAAVSPIVGGAALKGPLAKMMRETGIEPSPLGVARHYGALVDGWIIDAADREHVAAIQALGFEVRVTDTIMRNTQDKARLAEEALDFARKLTPRRPG